MEYANVLAAIAGAVLSLFFSLTPTVKDWFDLQAPNVKRGIMLALLALVAVAFYGASCGGLIDALISPLLGGQVAIAVSCDKAGALTLVQAFIYAAIANQAAYALTPKRQKDVDLYVHDTRSPRVIGR